MIEGVKITNLKKIDDNRGSVLTMLRSDSKVLSHSEKYIFQLYLINLSKLGIYIKKQF